MEPLLYRHSLKIAQFVAFATLLRSVAYDRWITVFASTLMLIGATQAKRGKVGWLGLTFASAAAFPTAWFIGIAPAWFCLVGAVGALPFLIASPALSKFDKGATRVLAAMAATSGGMLMVTWKYVALSLFMMFPWLIPSTEANHGFLLAALLAGAVAVNRREKKLDAAQASDRVRVRVDTEASTSSEAETLFHENERALHQAAR